MLRDAQTLPTLGELSADALNGSLSEQRRSALGQAQTMPLPFWRRTDLKDFSLESLQPVISEMTRALKQESQAVIDSQDQYEVCAEALMHPNNG